MSLVPSERRRTCCSSIQTYSDWLPSSCDESFVSWGGVASSKMTTPPSGLTECFEEEEEEDDVNHDAVAFTSSLTPVGDFGFFPSPPSSSKHQMEENPLEKQSSVPTGEFKLTHCTLVICHPSVFSFFLSYTVVFCKRKPSTLQCKMLLYSCTRFSFKHIWNYMYSLLFFLEKLNMRCCCPAACDYSSVGCNFPAILSPNSFGTLTVLCG